MIRAVLGLLALLLAGACANTLPPAPFKDSTGRVYELPAERNVPKETTARPGVEVKVYDKESWAEMGKLNCAHADGLLVVGCTLLLIPTFCTVWLVDASLLPSDVAARTRVHEVGRHCNGYVHILIQTPQGWVLEWQKPTS